MSIDILNLQSRSAVSFVVIACFATGAAVFLIQKGTDATNEIKLLKSSNVSAHRALIEQQLDEKEGLGTSSAPSANP
ncbi:MAG: hypothetical protein HY617_00510 [Candidatus Sungbacteria bacterium]|nr:hypothetical protein [Candidatus Sungbacteria bacterium]